MPASSMVPGLELGDHFIAKLEKYGDRLPRRGDIIVFPYPEDRSVDFVKRVIGLPGERIEIKDKVVFINGRPLEDPWGVCESNVTFPSNIAPRDNFGPVEVPKGSVFVLGDNRDYSHDSRFWGYVETKDIQGKPYSFIGPRTTIESANNSNETKELRNSGDTILNSQCRHSPLEAFTETRSMNIGDTHDPSLEELRAAHGQENKYGFL